MHQQVKNRQFYTHMGTYTNKIVYILLLCNCTFVEKMTNIGELSHRSLWSNYLTVNYKNDRVYQINSKPYLIR